MGLQLEISLDKTIREIDLFFDDLKFKAITLSARQALNRTATRVRSFSNKEIRKRRKLQLKEVKKRITISKAKGVNLAALQAKIRFSGMPLPMILFILGQKTPKKQTLPNPRRKSRRFEIIKGQKKSKKGLFIQRAQRGRMQFQVFRRKDPNDKSKGFRLQSVPSIAEVLRKKSNLLRRIENRGGRILETEYDRALAFQLQKLRL